MKYLKIIGMFMIVAFLASCDKDEDIINILKSETYDLTALKNNVSGKVTFDKLNDTETRIKIDINDDSTTPRPAHIHNNTAAETGAIAISLNPVVNGKSETTITALDNGTSITYEDLIEFNGYVNVHESSTDLGTVISQGDIGQNEFTGDSKMYTLEGRNGTDVNGTLLFQERANGSTLATFDLNNTADNVMHPAHIHKNSFAEGGDIVITFNSIDGSTGKSSTQIRTTDDGALISYDELLDYDGYVNVHLTASDLVVVSQTDIGSNEVNGDAKTYSLNELGGSGVSGTLTILERKNGNSLAVFALQGTISGTMHPAHIHEGKIENAPGAIAISFNPIDGDTGVSYTNITAKDNGTDLDYSQLIDYDGYVNVHLSSADLTVVAQGSFGSNAQ